MKENRKLLVVQYNNPAAFPPVIHICEILCSAGVEVHVLGVRGKDTEGLEFPGNIAERISIGVQPSSRYLLPWFWLFFNLKALFFAVWLRPRFVHVSDYTACLAGILISYVTSARVIYHEHDSPVGGGGKKNRMLLQLRRWLAKRARLCVLPNAGRAEAFELQTQCTQPAKVVWNCPTKAEIQAIIPDHSRTRSPATLSVAYAGTINDARVPPQLVEAMAKCPGVSLTLVGYETIGSRGYVARLKRLAEALNVGDTFHFEGSKSRSEVLKELLKHDVCLGLMPMHSDDINMRHMVGASNKAFDAFVCGLPVIVSDLSDWVDTYVAAGVAMACNPTDVNSVAAVFLQLQSNPEQCRMMGEKARAMVEQNWNYEKQFEPVLKAMEFK